MKRKQFISLNCDDAFFLALHSHFGVQYFLPSYGAALSRNLFTNINAYTSLRNSRIIYTVSKVSICKNHSMIYFRTTTTIGPTAGTDRAKKSAECTREWCSRHKKCEMRREEKNTKCRRKT